MEMPENVNRCYHLTAHLIVSNQTVSLFWYGTEKSMLLLTVIAGSTASIFLVISFYGKLTPGIHLSRYDIACM